MKHTVREWNLRGRRVKAGERAKYWRADGKALFDQSQTLWLKKQPE